MADRSSIVAIFLACYILTKNGPGIISGLDCFTCDVTKNGTVGLNPCNSSMPCDPEIEDQMCLSWISYDNRSFWVGCIEKAAAESCVFKPSIYCDDKAYCSMDDKYCYCKSENCNSPKELPGVPDFDLLEKIAIDRYSKFIVICIIMSILVTGGTLKIFLWCRQMRQIQKEQHEEAIQKANSKEMLRHKLYGSGLSSAVTAGTVDSLNGTKIVPNAWMSQHTGSPMSTADTGTNTRPVTLARY